MAVQANSTRPKFAPLHMAAGIQHATTPIAAIITATPMNMLGSCGAPPKGSPGYSDGRDDHR